MIERDTDREKNEPDGKKNEKEFCTYRPVSIMKAGRAI